MSVFYSKSLCSIFLGHFAMSTQNHFHLPDRTSWVPFSLAPRNRTTVNCRSTGPAWIILCRSFYSKSLCSIFLGHFAMSTPTFFLISPTFSWFHRCRIPFISLCCIILLIKINLIFWMQAWYPELICFRVFN
jgi:hypothetical protein